MSAENGDVRQAGEVGVVLSVAREIKSDLLRGRKETMNAMHDDPEWWNGLVAAWAAAAGIDPGDVDPEVVRSQLVRRVWGRRWTIKMTRRQREAIARGRARGHE